MRQQIHLPCYLTSKYFDMNQTKLLLAAFLLAVSTLISCQKEISNDLAFTTQDPTYSANITTTIEGRITDELSKPLQGVLVKAGSTNVVTNINGEFTLTNVSVYDKAAFVQASKQGYFDGSRTFIAKQGGSHYVEIKMLPNQSIGTINAASGGSVTLSNGTSVTLPASAVVVASSNAPYTGTVNVSFAWIDPTSNNVDREMPGDLRGISNANTEVGLQTFGMVAVELKSPIGEKLQIAAGKKAALKFFLPATLTATSPNEIALWSFNENNGLWKQEGTATKSGTFYNAEVSHFSFWNCDAPFPTVQFTATIKYANGESARRKMVRIRRTNTTGFTTGFTDTAGVVRGLVPANEALILEVLNECNNILHTQNIGPFSAAANIAVTITGSTIQAATVSGTAINCSSVAIANGIADLVTGQRTYRTSIVNGAFSFNLSICSASQSATLVIIDTANSQQNSSTITLVPGANNVGSVSGCGTSITQFINYSVNGTPYSILPPADSVTAGFNIQNNRTVVSGYTMNAGSMRSIEFSFSGNTVGTSNLTALRINSPSGGGSLGSNVIPATITEYGPAGGFIAGSFSGNISDSAIIRTVQCTFRVRRY